MYYERTIEKTVRNISDTFPVLLLTGPRQVGKSTLLERMAEPERKRVSLDVWTTPPSVRWRRTTRSCFYSVTLLRC